VYVSGSEKPMAVAEKHAVKMSAMKPPFPARTELAMFGQLPLLIFFCVFCLIVVLLLLLIVPFNVPSNFFQYALKSVVFERHIFMPEHLNFVNRCHPRPQRSQSHVTLA